MKRNGTWTFAAIVALAAPAAIAGQHAQPAAPVPSQDARATQRTQSPIGRALAGLLQQMSPVAAAPQSASTKPPAAPNGEDRRDESAPEPPDDQVAVH